MKIDINNRPDLWELEEQIRNCIFEGMNPCWRRTYEDLLHAVNVLDAHHARSEVAPPAVQPKELTAA